MNFHQYLVSWLQHCEDTATCFISSGQCTIAIVHFSSSFWILHDFHRMVQHWCFTDLRCRVCRAGAAPAGGAGWRGCRPSRWTRTWWWPPAHWGVTVWKAGVSLDILCNCSIRANNNLNINIIDTWTPVDSYLIKNWTQTHNQKLTSPTDILVPPFLPIIGWPLTIASSQSSANGGAAAGCSVPAGADLAEVGLKCPRCVVVSGNVRMTPDPGMVSAPPRVTLPPSLSSLFSWQAELLSVCSRSVSADDHWPRCLQLQW